MIRLTIAKNRASALSRRSIVASFATTKDGDNKSKKENFAKKFLEPAARGELQKHQSGIPKLAVRKPKGHSVKDSFPGKESDEILKDALAYSTESSNASGKGPLAGLRVELEGDGRTTDSFNSSLSNVSFLLYSGHSTCI